MARRIYPYFCWLILLLAPTALAQSNFRVVSTLQIPYEGAMISFGIADFAANGTTTLIAGGFRWPMVDQTVPFKAINVSRLGILSDISSSLFEGAPAQSWGRRGVVADFNGDGRPDFFSASHGFDAAPFPGDYQLLLLSQPNGKLKDESATLLPQLRQFVHSAAAADVKRNGRPDIFVGVYNNKRIAGLDPAYGAPSAPQPDWFGPYMMRNDGAGHFAFDNRTLADKVTFGWDTRANPWALWDSPGTVNSAAFADLNNDGYPDLILGGSQSTNEGSAYFNDGNGGFRTTEYQLPVGLFGVKNTITADILAYDIDGDGLVDLVLSQTPAGYVGSKLQILVNKGSGVFVDETATRLPNQNGAGHWVEFLKAIDLDGDGIRDVFLHISNPATAQVIAYRNDGRGNFSPMPAAYLPPTQGYPWMTPVDFNGDGRIDFISINNNPNANQTTFTVFENTNSQMRGPNDSDRVFNYIEFAYPQFLTSWEVTRGTVAGYYYRYYGPRSAYVATSNSTLYYLGPASSNAILPLGPLADWLARAVSAGF